MTGRRKLLAAVHAAKRDLALEEESYRALLARLTGRSSAADLSDDQLRDVLREFGRLGWNREKRSARRAGARRLAEGDQARKARALWLDLYHLAEVRDPAEAALVSFAKRLTKADALEWVPAEGMNRVIEALKSWSHRAGVNPELVAAAELERINGSRAHVGKELVGEAFLWQHAVLLAQWEKLRASGAMRHAFFANLGTWISKRWGVTSPAWLSAEEIGQAVEQLGRWLRQVTVSADA